MPKETVSFRPSHSGPPKAAHRSGQVKKDSKWPNYKDTAMRHKIRFFNYSKPPKISFGFQKMRIGKSAGSHSRSTSILRSATKAYSKASYQKRPTSRSQKSVETSRTTLFMVDVSLDFHFHSPSPSHQDLESHNWTIGDLSMIYDFKLLMFLLQEISQMDLAMGPPPIHLPQILFSIIKKTSFSIYFTDGESLRDPDCGLLNAYTEHGMVCSAQNDCMQVDRCFKIQEQEQCLIALRCDEGEYDLYRRDSILSPLIESMDCTTDASEDDKATWDLRTTTNIDSMISAETIAHVEEKTPKTLWDILGNGDDLSDFLFQVAKSRLKLKSFKLLYMWTHNNESESGDYSRDVRVRFTSGSEFDSQVSPTCTRLYHDWESPSCVRRLGPKSKRSPSLLKRIESTRNSIGVSQSSAEFDPVLCAVVKLMQENEFFGKTEAKIVSLLKSMENFGDVRVGNYLTRARAQIETFWKVRCKMGSILNRGMAMFNRFEHLIMKPPQLLQVRTFFPGFQSELESIVRLVRALIESTKEVETTFEKLKVQIEKVFPEMNNMVLVGTCMEGELHRHLSQTRIPAATRDEIDFFVSAFMGKLYKLQDLSYLSFPTEISTTYYALASATAKVVEALKDLETIVVQVLRNTRIEG